MTIGGKRVWYPIAARDDHTRPKGGINNSWYVGTDSVAKGNSEDSPYLIANEWIAGRIAQFLCLPIPPFALVRSFGKRGLFASLMFTAKDEEPPDIWPSACFKAMPETCTGIVLFDILIANYDRRAKNISVDDPDKPTRIRIWDHDRALFGHFAGQGIARIKEMWDRTGITGGIPSGGDRHVLLDSITTTEYAWNWVERIVALPKWYIQDTCKYVIGCPITKRECGQMVEFLEHRSRNFHKLLIDHKSEFKNVTQRGLFV